MDTDRWQRLRQLARDALDQAPGARQSWLAVACGEDQQLLQEARALLAQLETDGQFDAWVQDVVASEAQDIAAAARLGQVLGAYRLERKIDEGGMGAVYLAERADQAYSSQVAIKLLRAGSYSEDTARRFASERQILAKLQHPYVCQLLDGGTTPDGQPYLVMEYIDGVDIEQWCNDQRLGVQDRLTLFSKVCEAVDYLHRNLIVHRDIKPSNILIQDGIPKLLDFGIAKAIADSPTDATIAGQRALTPIFASPEQVRGEAVTTLTDVYGLGVVLYRLLSGQHPYAPRDQSLQALEAAVCDSQPLLPSSSVTRSEAPAHAPAVPALRSAEKLGEWRRALAGDLDNIVLKCLQKEPERRYESALAVADDIQRYLQHEPVEARASSVTYRLGKLLRRNRAVAGTSAALLLVLVASIGYYTWQLAQERDRLALEVEKTRAVSGFLTELFGAADPNLSGGQLPTVSEVLDRGAERVRRELAEQPEVQGELMFAIGSSYARLRDYPAARTLFEDGLALIDKETDSAAAFLSQALSEYGLLMLELNELDTAAALFGRVMSRERQAGRAGSVLDSNAQLRLADVEREQGKFAVAEERLLPLLERLRKQSATQGAQLFSALAVYGHLLRLTSRWEESEAIELEALAVARARFPDTPHDSIGTALNNLGNTYRSQSNYEAAMRFYREAVQAYRDVYGEDNLAVARALANQAAVINELGRFEQALALGEEALALFVAALGEQHPQVAFLKENNAAVLLNLGRKDEALAVYEQSVDLVRTVFGAEHAEYATSLSNLAGVLLALERFDEAERASEEAYRISVKTRGAQHYASAAIKLKTARAVRGRGELTSALAMMGDVLSTLEGQFAEPTLQHLNTLEELGRTLALSKDYGESERRYADAVALAGKLQGETVHRWRLELELARVLLALGRRDEAVVLRDRASAAYAEAGQTLQVFEALLAETDTELRLGGSVPTGWD